LFGRVGDIRRPCNPPNYWCIAEQEFESPDGTATAELARWTFEWWLQTNRDLTRDGEEGRLPQRPLLPVECIPNRLPHCANALKIFRSVQYVMQKYKRAGWESACENCSSATMQKLVALALRQGNVRALQNMIERGGNSLTWFCLEIQRRNGACPHPVPSESNGALTLKLLSDNIFCIALRATGWVRGGPAGAAVRLGLNRRPLSPAT